MIFKNLKQLRNWLIKQFIIPYPIFVIISIDFQYLEGFYENLWFHGLFYWGTTLNLFDHEWYKTVMSPIMWRKHTESHGDQSSEKYHLVTKMNVIYQMLSHDETVLPLLHQKVIMNLFIDDLCQLDIMSSLFLVMGKQFITNSNSLLTSTFFAWIAAAFSIRENTRDKIWVKVARAVVWFTNDFEAKCIL